MISQRVHRSAPGSLHLSYGSPFSALVGFLNVQMIWSLILVTFLRLLSSCWFVLPSLNMTGFAFIILYLFLFVCFLR